MNRQGLIFVIIIALAQSGAWFQQFSQIKWDWFRNNTWFNIGILGIILSILFVYGARIGYEAWESVWKIRLIQFAIGAFVVSFWSWFILGEGVNLKTFVCLMLALGIILIQVFWK